MESIHDREKHSFTEKSLTFDILIDNFPLFIPLNYDFPHKFGATEKYLKPCRRFSKLRQICLVEFKNYLQSPEIVAMLILLFP